MHGTLGFSLGRRVSLMLTTDVGAVTGLSAGAAPGNLDICSHLPRKGLSVLDVAFVAAAAFPPRRRCAIMGPLLDELLLATFLGPLLTANLRAPPCLTLFATDASLSGARACSSTVSFEQWTKLYDLSEERGELVCLDWCACPPVDTDPRDGRASAFFTTVELPWEEFFSYRFRTF